MDFTGEKTHCDPVHTMCGWATRFDHRTLLMYRRLQKDKMMITNTAILEPVTALLLLTCVMWVWMYATRLPAVRNAGMSLDPDLPNSGERLPLLVRGRQSVDWRSDTVRIERGSDGRSVARLVPGRHRITALKPASGQFAEAWVTVEQL